MALKRKANVYQITMPPITTNTFNWYFTVAMPDGTYTFNFMWTGIDVEGGTNSGWYFYYTSPKNIVNNGRVSPNAINFSQSSDIGMVWTSSLQSIGQNDLGSTQMFMLYWL